MRMRDLAARDDEKPFQVESSSSGRFRAWMNRSHPEGDRLLLWISTDGRLWRVENKKSDRQTKDAERRDKMSVRTGKVTQAGQAA